MLARVAAYAALFLFSPVCSGIDGSSVLPRPQSAASVAQQRAPDVLRQELKQALDTPIENQIAPQRDAYAATPIERAEPADHGAAISIERSIERPRNPEPEPFGLDRVGIINRAINLAI